MIRYQTKENDVLDEVIFRIHGILDAGIVEATLEANRGLADYGPLLPAGLVIQIPERNATPVQPSITLWS